MFYLTIKHHINVNAILSTINPANTNAIILVINFCLSIFFFASSVAAITILYIFSFVFVLISLSIPKNLVNLLVPKLL